MSQIIRRKPLEPTVEAFADLVIKVCEEKKLATIMIAANYLQIAAGRLIEIRKAKLPDFKMMTKRQVEGYAASIVRVCEGFELDIESCLTACGLPYIANVVEQATLSVNPAYFTKESLTKLLALVELTGKPVPMDFGLKFLALQK